MTDDVVTDAGAKPEPGIRGDQFSELSIHVGFHNLPVISYPNDSETEQPVKYGPPFLRFPVNLTAEDAAVLKNILNSAAIAFVGFEVKDSDGHARVYRSVVAA